MNYSELQGLSLKEVKCELIKYKNGIYHFHFKNSKDLTSTLLRFQEFYESPHFKDKKISLWNFYNYYKKFTKKTNFSYCTDWEGFNLPDWVFKKFKNDLSVRESSFVSHLPLDQKFYIIGTCGSKKTKDYKDVLLHEKAHALYFLNPKYRSEVNEITRQKNFKALVQYLKELGYNEKVIIDEIQAYMIADFRFLLKEGKVNKNDLSYHKKIKSLYRKFS